MAYSSFSTIPKYVQAPGRCTSSMRLGRGVDGAHRIEERVYLRPVLVRAVRRGDGVAHRLVERCDGVWSAQTVCFALAREHEGIGECGHPLDRSDS